MNLIICIIKFDFISCSKKKNRLLFVIVDFMNETNLIGGGGDDDVESLKQSRSTGAWRISVAGDDVAQPHNSEHPIECFFQNPRRVSVFASLRNKLEIFTQIHSPAAVANFRRQRPNPQLLDVFKGGDCSGDQQHKQRRNAGDLSCSASHFFLSVEHRNSKRRK